MAVYSLTIRNRGIALLLGLVVLGAGAALLVVGIALLAAVAVAGGLLGLGILAYRKLRGVPTQPLGMGSETGLDPSLEVFPEPEVLPRDYPSGREAPNAKPPRLPGE
jgi:hypothetical protein